MGKTDTIHAPQADHYAKAEALAMQAGTVAAPPPDRSPVEEVLGGPLMLNGVSASEYPGVKVLADGTAEPDHGQYPASEVPPAASPSPSSGCTEGGCSSGGDCGLVAFSVARAKYKHRKAGTTGTQVLFDKVLASVGPGFNHTGGYLRCECPGYYHFSFHGVSPLQGRARLDLMRNRQRVASTEAQYYGFGSGSNTAIIHLQKGDIVYVYLAQGFLYENDARFRGYASFSGFRLQG
ncbi:complement C1q tumor necrosis factor-related protein 4-like [Portunus trituberculatus]|uniref:complement C1q tumor necrosis factor-related protein 4-like n=1 Tax=Portunus trituberculatus TaxID=210409 RepID=UPI001E1CB927|nr:complement C1q tumor necrosis factor-related protein 4-like [Portunus trituberculatus]